MSYGVGGRLRGAVGADDGPIEIVDYERSWPATFIAERERLAPLLPGVAIHHIGSTAVPGAPAKPVIDMIALVDRLDANADLLIKRAGYDLPARFNDGLVHRRYLCYPTPAYRTHHLHLVDVPEDLDRCLRFRDKLRSDPRLAAQYASLKRGLAARFRADRASYTAAKTEFIERAALLPNGSPPRGSNAMSAMERHPSDEFSSSPG
jgi:GrpB-like predicted nucleotidyltransferase (UPF0157 family)